MDPVEVLEVAERAALEAGGILSAAWAAGSGSDRVSQKGPGDYVTEVDRESERAVRATLAVTGIPVVGEEEGGGGGATVRWIVDPLDGTTNFVHRLPAVAVSIALVDDRGPLVGVVRAPFLEETYLGVRGSGARVRRRDGAEETLRVSSRPVERAVVGTGFPFRRKDLLSRYLEMFGEALARFEDLRRPGAAALDLAWVASGVFDGFFELALNPWDVAAGGLLITEAGGVVSDWEGGGAWLEGDILAGGAAVHGELVHLAGATADTPSESTR